MINLDQKIKFVKKFIIKRLSMWNREITNMRVTIMIEFDDVVVAGKNVELYKEVLSGN